MDFLDLLVRSRGRRNSTLHRRQNLCLANTLVLDNEPLLQFLDPDNIPTTRYGALQKRYRDDRQNVQKRDGEDYEALITRKR